MVKSKKKEYGKMTFGEKLRRARESCNLRQETLGKVLNTSQRKISHLEKDETEPSLANLIMICNYFGVSADYFLGLPYTLKKPL